MNPRSKMMLAGALGLFAGAGATTLLAQPSEPKAYLIGNVAEVTDPAAFKDYTAKVAVNYAQYGGHLIARGAAQALDGQAGTWAAKVPPKGNMVVIEFPSMEKLQAWWHSPEYAAIRPLRENAATGTNFVIAGAPPA